MTPKEHFAKRNDQGVGNPVADLMYTQREVFIQLVQDWTRSQVDLGIIDRHEANRQRDQWIDRFDRPKSS